MVEPRGNVGGGTPANYTWTYGYDEVSNRTSVTDPLTHVAQYTWDEINHLTSVTDQRGNTTSLVYDVLDRIDTVTPPAAGATGTLATAYTYDADSNLASRTDPYGHGSDLDLQHGRAARPRDLADRPHQLHLRRQRQPEDGRNAGRHRQPAPPATAPSPTAMTG